jgi:hypothetical protein
MGGAHEVRFVEPQRLNKGAQVRQRRLADPDDADFGGFDQVNVGGMRQHAHKTCRCHPADGTAAEDHYPLLGLRVAHAAPCTEAVG